MLLPDSWKGKLRDVPVFLIGNGPSLSDHDLSPLADYFTIGINRAFKPYIPFDPTILLWQDETLLKTERDKLETCESFMVIRNTMKFRDAVQFRLRTRENEEVTQPSAL